MKESEMGRTYIKHGKDQKCIQILIRKPEYKDHLKDLGMIAR
jgi:hypothetical protein